MTSLDIQIRGATKDQHDLISDLKPGWILVSGGLGSGKSHSGILHLVLLHAINNESWGLAIAPTSEDIGRLIVSKLVEVCSSLNLDYDYSPTGNKKCPYRHFLLFGRPILLLSGEAPERFKGFQVAHIMVDEAATIYESDNPSSDFFTQMPRRLRCPKAKILQGLFCTTPEGTSTWVYKRFYEQNLPDHRKYQLSTYDNPFITKDYIESIKRELPLELQEQYLLGIPVDYSARRAHPSFGQENIRTIDVNNLSGDITWHLGADFNTQNMSWMLGVMHNGVFDMVDEAIIEKNAMVDQMVHLCHSRGWANKRRIHLHVDKSSKNARTTSDSEFKILSNTARSLQWEISGTADGANPEVSSRINVANMTICNANNERKFFIDPKCTTTIKFLRGHPRLPNGNYSKKPIDPNCLDSLGYCLFDLFKPAQNKPFTSDRFRA